LDPLKSILVFSHVHNSFDKKTLLKDAPNQFVNKTNISVNDYIKEAEIKQFFMEDIDKLLDSYEYGKPEHKPDVVKQMQEISDKRQKIIEKHTKEQAKQRDTNVNNKINEMTMIMNEVLLENNQLKEKVKYLEEKIAKIISQQIEEKKKHMNK
jgi:hypothetical protein